jgi:hypothetical protein
MATSYSPDDAAARLTEAMTPRDHLASQLANHEQRLDSHDAQLHDAAARLAALENDDEQLRD